MINFSDHALDRLVERGITVKQVVACLESGIAERPKVQLDGKHVITYRLGDLVVILGKDLSIVTVYRTTIAPHDLKD